MLHKPSNKFQSVKRHFLSFSLIGIILIEKVDIIPVDRIYPVVGNGNTLDVTSEVVDNFSGT